MSHRSRLIVFRLELNEYLRPTQSSCDNAPAECSDASNCPMWQGPARIGTRIGWRVGAKLGGEERGAAGSGRLASCSPFSRCCARAWFCCCRSRPWRCRRCRVCRPMRHCSPAAMCCVRTTMVRHPRRDCQEFRVWPGIVGTKEISHGPTQRACDS